jgi:hypothetical protein
MSFGTLIVLGSTERSIVVETHKGRRLENSIALPPGQIEKRKYDLLRSRHPQWRQRTAACGVYNCFGHLFASRRTSIRDDTEVEKVLHDDGYRRLTPDERVAAGDIILYRNREDGRLLHAGQVCAILRLHSTGSGVIQVLSKWDDACGEDEHAIDDVPYESYGIEHVAERWTERGR